MMPLRTISDFCQFCFVAVARHRAVLFGHARSVIQECYQTQKIGQELQTEIMYIASDEARQGSKRTLKNRLDQQYRSEGQTLML